MLNETYTTRVDRLDARKSLVEQAKDDPIGLVNKLLGVTEPVVNQRALIWDRYQRKYRRGLTYLMGVTSETPLYFTNYVFSVVEAAKANLTRNMPELSAKPKGIKDDTASNLMSRVLKDALNRAGLKNVSRQVLHYGLINTLGWYKVGYDEDIDELALMACHPRTVLVDPSALDYREARWIIHKLPNQDASKVYEEYGTYPSKKDSDEGRVVGTLTTDMRSNLYSVGDNMASIIDVAPTVDVYECWLRDYSKKRKNDWYILTVANDVVLEEKYSPYDHNCHPFVPWIAMEDYNADNYYTRGAGYVEEMEPLQDRADALDLRIYKNIALTSNRQKIVSGQSGVNPALVDNTQGRVLIANGDPSKAVYYDIPPQFGTDVYQYRSQTDLLIQTVTGIMDVTQGRRPTGIIAGRAIQSLKDSAEVRLADTGDTHALTLSAVGALAIQIILQFFDKDRIIRATDANDTDLRVIAEYPESLQPDSDLLETIQAQQETEAMYRGAGFVYSEELPPDQQGIPTPLSPPPVAPGQESMGMMGSMTPQAPGMTPTALAGLGAPPPQTDLMSFVPDDPPPEDMEDIDGISPELRQLRDEWKTRNDIALVLEDVQYEWDIIVNTDTALPTSNTERGQVAADLFRLGAIDRKALLDALNYPNAEAILGRLEGNVTGKDAGSPDAEAGNGAIQAMMQAFGGILSQLGVPQEMLPSIMEEVQNAASQGQQPPGGQQQPGGFPPQIAM